MQIRYQENKACIHTYVAFAEYQQNEYRSNSNAGNSNDACTSHGRRFITVDMRDLDHSFFQLSQSQANAIDPEQRILLEIAYEALESGGISRETTTGTTTSVYAAISSSRYSSHVNKTLFGLHGDHIAGMDLSNRISHALQLKGPSVTLRGEESKSLVALHLACQSLRDGESDTALVTASNLTPGIYDVIQRDNSESLGSTEQRDSFPDDGYDYGYDEAVIVLVLKRLDAAIRDRNPVRAIIRNTTIGHGIETPAVIETFNDSLHHTPLYIASIEGASGLFSLLKAIFMLDHQMIPPSSGFTMLQKDVPLRLVQAPTKDVPWQKVDGIMPWVYINSLGSGDANSHIIIEREPARKIENAAVLPNSASPFLFTLSANSPASLKSMIKAHKDWAERHGRESSLIDISYTLLHRRSALPFRFSAVANDHALLVDAFSQALTGHNTKELPAKLDIVGIFTGQGSQWAGMGRELLLERTTPSSIFRDSIRTSRDILYNLGATWNLETELLRVDSALDKPELSQPATTAIQVALIALLHKQGLRFRAVVGHSSGEIAAAYAAGYLSHKTAMKIAFHAGQLEAAANFKGLGPGVMMSVGVGEHDAIKYLQALTTGSAVIACVNSPHSVTISGDSDAITEVQNRINQADDGTFHRKLVVGTAYHSHHMSAVADIYRAKLGDLEGDNCCTSDCSETVSFISSVTGQLKRSDFDSEYWVTNIVSQVRFADAIQTLAKDYLEPNHHAFFVEIGPHPALSGPVRQVLQQHSLTKLGSFDYHAALKRNVDATSSVLTLTGKLFERGAEFHRDIVSAVSHGDDTAVVLHNLPSYPWDHSTKHWYLPHLIQASKQFEEPYHDLLGQRITNKTDLTPRWHHFISQEISPWLRDHRVDGSVTFPAAGYIAMVIEAAAQLTRIQFPKRSLEIFAFQNVALKHGLILPENELVEVQLSMQQQPNLDVAFSFIISARLNNDPNWTKHATGIVEITLSDEFNVTTEATEETELPQLPTGSITIPREALYRELDLVGNTYGPAFSGLEYIVLAPNGSHAFSSLRVLDFGTATSAKHRHHHHIIHPATLESVLQTSIALVSRQEGSAGAIVPMHFDELLISGTASLNSPGSRLEVSTSFASSHYNTALCDISVSLGGHQVLSISAVELRKSESHMKKIDATASVIGAAVNHNICYELDWHIDIDHIRTDDMPRNLSLVDIISLITLKNDAMTILGLGIGLELSEEFLKGLRSHTKKSISYDFVEATPGLFDDAAELLKEFPVQFRTIQPGTSPIARGFAAGAYDVVLTTSAKWLEQTAVLVKPNGIVIVVVNGPHSEDNAWHQILLKTSAVHLEERLAFRDDANDRVIVIAKPTYHRPLLGVHILTHLSYHNVPSWVSDLVEKIGGDNANVSIGPLSSTNGTQRNSNPYIIIAIDDNRDMSIIADKDRFYAVTGLLSRVTSVIWVSFDSRWTTFCEIEGLVHNNTSVENDDLHLIKILADLKLLETGEGVKRLVEVIASVASQVVNPSISHSECEYRIRGNGAVMVPRLHHSERLNKAMVAENKTRSDTERRIFCSNELPLVLARDSSALFIEDNDAAHSQSLPENAIEIVTQTFVVSRSGSDSQLGQYTGVVTNVGVQVNSLAPGDRVIALGPVVGTSRLRIPHTLASRLALNIPPTAATALFLATIAASHAIRGIARILSARGTILIHGARTVAGRAAVAVARSIGVRVIVTASKLVEADLLVKELGVSVADVFLTRRCLGRRWPRDIFADGLDAAILTTDDDTVPTEALSHMKPFGNVISVCQSLSSIAAASSMLPPNVAYQSFDIESLLQARPDLIANLVAGAATALEHVPLGGLDILVHDVEDVSEALQLIHTGLHQKVVLNANPTSAVQVVPAQQPSIWEDKNATYILVGDLSEFELSILLEIAERGAYHIGIVSPSAPNSGIYEVLRRKLEIIKRGIQLYHFQVDDLSEHSLQSAAIALSHRGAPPVRGIIQVGNLESVFYSLFALSLLSFCLFLTPFPNSYETID